MSFEFNNDTLFFDFSIRAQRRRTVDPGEPPTQVVELRLRQSSLLVTRSSHQIFQQTPPTLIANPLFSFPLQQLQNPPPLFPSNSDMVQFLSQFNLPIAISHRIASFALRIAAGNVHLSFHIVATVDFVETFWVEMGPVESPAAGRGAPATAIERLRNQKFELELEEMGDCSVCCDELDGEMEVTRIPCGHVFHQSCILNWLHMSNSCPLCRTKLEE